MRLTLDLRCGVSGDMLLGALLDWYSMESDVSVFIRDLSRAASVQSPTRINSFETDRGGKKVRRLEVEWDRLESGTTSGIEMKAHLEKALVVMGCKERSKKVARRMLNMILEAEAAVHNESGPDQVHLHEAGTPDTLVDVVGIAQLYDKLEVDGYWVRGTPISLGRGMIATAHGAYEIPVPAVRHMLREIPANTGPVDGELATPTGVAAAKSIVEIWLDDEEGGDCASLPGKPVGRGAGEREYTDEFTNTLTIYEEADDR
ncbi:MAG: nickel insertion protein [Thermoplasmatota archaeon]